MREDSNIIYKDVYVECHLSAKAADDEVCGAPSGYIRDGMRRNMLMPNKMCNVATRATTLGGYNNGKNSWRVVVKGMCMG